MKITRDIFRFARAAYAGEPLKYIPDSGKATLQAHYNKSQACLMAKYDNRMIIMFRGSDEWRDWLYNFNFRPLAQGKTIHQGFYDAWLLLKEQVRKWITRYGQSEDLICTGHSLGGALATLCARDIAKNLGRKCSLITYGSPKVFNREGRDQFKFLPINATRVYTQYDPVPNLPPYELSFRHIGEDKKLKQNIFMMLNGLFGKGNHGPDCYQKYLDKDEQKR